MSTDNTPPRAPEVWLLPTGEVAVRDGADSWRVMEPEGDEHGIYELPGGTVELRPLPRMAAELMRVRAQRDAALALIDELFATFLIPHDPADPLYAGWTRGASVRTDVADEWRARRAALASAP